MKTAVIVIDMINDFVTGKLGFKGAEAIIPKIQKLLATAHAKGIPVIYMCDAHSPEDPEIRIWGEHAMAGTKGAQVIPELKPEKGEPIMEKHTYNSFFDTGLDELLRKWGIHKLVLAGVTTDICVMNSAAEAFFRGYRVVVPKDCVASPDKKAHRNALNYMKRVYGASLISSRELIKQWGK